MSSGLHGSPSARAARWALAALLTSSAAACTETPDPVDPSRKMSLCAGSPERCEEAIGRAVLAHDDASALLHGLAELEASAGKPALKELLSTVTTAESPARALVVDVGGSSTLSVPETVTRVTATGLGARSDLVWVALAETANADLLYVDHGGGKISRVYGRDPVLSFLGGGVPVVTQTGAATPDVAREVAIEAALREAVKRAGAFDYVGAAKAVDRLAPALELDGASVTRLRAQVVLNAVNLSESPLASGEEDDATKPAAPAPAWPTESLGAYYELLRHGSDDRPGVDHDARLAAALAAVDATPRPWLTRRYQTDPRGCPPKEALTFTRREDLALASYVPGLLAREGSRSRMGKLPLAEWDALYASVVDVTVREELAFYVLPSLLAERGGYAGMNRSGVAAHARVTELAKRHVEALRELAEAMPGRVGVAQLGFVGSPGAFLDRELGDPLRTLAERSSQDAVKGATDVQHLLEVALMGALISLNMPPAIRDSYVGSLGTAFVSRLRGDFAKDVGLSAAAAHALELAYRTAFGLQPNPTVTAAAITRTLEGDPNLPEAGLASLGAALVRYAALGAEGTLGAIYLEPGDSTLPARTEARAALAKALTKLHADGPKDEAAVLELAALLDNVAATITYAIREAVVAGPPPARCADPEDSPTDPKITRALGKLADQRKKVLAHKGLAGKDPWAARARALTILLSDGLDVTTALLAPEPKNNRSAADSWDPSVLAKLHVTDADARASLTAALATFELDATIGLAVGSFHSLVRGYFAHGGAHLRGAGRDDVSVLFGSFGALMGGPSSNVASVLLDFARAMSAGPGDAGATLARFTTVAEELYAAGKKPQADMVLLASVAASAVTTEKVPDSAIALARKHGGDAALPLDLIRYRHDGVAATPRGPVQFRKELEAIAADRCVEVSVDTVAGVLDALDTIKSGEREKGRLALEDLLSRPDPGLNVPKVSYVFRHASGKQASNVQLSLDLASPLVMGQSGFNVGAGFTSIESELFELDVSVESPDTKASREGSGRYYVHANAIAGLVHFLDGDTTRGEEAAMRAIGTSINRTWFFEPTMFQNPAVFATDATATFAMLAQLAIDKERPLLAGDLLQLAKHTLGPEARPADVDAAFDPLPKALEGVPGAPELAARAKKTFALAAAGLPCTGAKLDKQAFVAPTCKEYGRAVALRVADATTAHPVLSTKKGAGECEHAALDAFMDRAFKGDYSDDKFERAVQRLQDDGKHYDAWVMLTRLRKPSHCSKAVSDALTVSLSKVKAPAQRADLLAARLNCDLAATPEIVTKDVEELRDALVALGDPAREVAAAVIVGSLSVQRKEPKLARLFPGAPRFLDRHRRSLAELPAALFLDHTSRTLAGEAIELDKTAADVSLVCGAKPREIAQLCTVLETLRDPERSDEEKRRAASESVVAAAP